MDNKKYLELKIDGKIVKYEILYTFKFEENDKTYLVYTDNTYDENNQLNVYVGEYDRSAKMVLKDIQDDNIFNSIQDIIETITNGGDNNANWSRNSYVLCDIGFTMFI